MKKTISLSLILLILLTVLLAGCTTQPAGPGGTQPPTLTPTPTTTPVITTTATTTVATVAANPPRVRILSPEDVGIAGPTNFTVTVAVENFQLVDALGGANVPGEGHIHYFLDVDAPPLQGSLQSPQPDGMLPPQILPIPGPRFPGDTTLWR